MSLTPPPLRSGFLPAEDFSHGGHGGAQLGAIRHRRLVRAPTAVHVHLHSGERRFVDLHRVLRAQLFE